ncbi:hypothetical protein Y032_0008g234 [Ancylostoma ceylanicum]|uniref:Uncharacterized protein n=1 Tax=Ancylostoma ceylanicum TaxID=53326 RepID=A0A016VLI3_9BILA|nr:hypothetical protein Y032_0008g234 [Ancylostoma ceylanicum]
MERIEKAQLIESRQKIQHESNEKILESGTNGSKSLKVPVVTILFSWLPQSAGSRLDQSTGLNEAVATVFASPFSQGLQHGQSLQYFREKLSK